ncbi:MAG: anaerobic ribonucleoside-triphosphate reductase activating protein [bacterium]|nr:anaerobic ribonucleoside-triphosphate reductase activating protein [bacterium]
MLISGIQPFTLLDYPNQTACVVFTPGCNFRCGYCHNPEFVLPENIQKIKGGFIPEESFFNFLRQRIGLLDGVVVSGGEPTIAPDLLNFMEKVKTLGFLVKLDTNGNRPEIIKQAIAKGVVDYVAMDVKTSLEAYPRLVGRLVSVKNIAESIELLKTGAVKYEFRSTLIKTIHSPVMLQSMAELLRGAERVYLQSFRPGITLDPTFSEYNAFSAEEMEHVAELFRTEVGEVVVR